MPLIKKCLVSIRLKTNSFLTKKLVCDHFCIGLITIAFLILLSCEDENRFYRPNHSEMLCSLSLINADDTSRYISFEKSYQIEYPDILNDSLKELTFTISSLNKDIFKYSNNETIKDLKYFKLPDSIEFYSGITYNLIAQEKDSPDISAEIIVPHPPLIPTLVSVSRETTKLINDPKCSGWENAKIAVINISFDNNIDKEPYYALLVEGTGLSFRATGANSSGFLDFSVKDSNTPGFFAIIQSLKMFHYVCKENDLVQSPVSAYFLEGSKFYEHSCTLSLAVEFSDNYCVYDVLKSIRIKLLTIPKELFLFEKSLYTYKQTQGDPFTEPVYLNGNIKNGNGIFAICRSSELLIKF